MLASKEAEVYMSGKDVLKGRSIVRKNVFDTANQTIEEIKRENPIVEYFRSRGVVLKKKGKEYKGLCPFHEDTNPSLSVNAEKQVFNCFGCGKGGTVIDAAAYYGSLSTGEAIKTLQKKPGKAEPEAKSKPGAGKDETSPADETISNIDLSTIAEYYHKKLYNNEEAIKYLKERGFDRPEIYSRFNIGFSDGSLLSKISDRQKQALIDIGILNEKGYEHFKNCVTFSIYDDNEQAAGIYGRDINEDSNFKHRYLKGKHRGVFNRKASKVYDEIILTESIIDALSLIVSGLENVQSIYGTNGFTDEHLRILKDDRVKTVIPAFDNDKPGKEASGKLKEKLISEGFNVKVIYPPLKSQNGKEIFYKDWNHCLTDKLDPEIIRQQIANAEIHESANDVSFKVSKDQLGYMFKINEVTYRITGVKNMFISNLRVNIKAELKKADTPNRAEGKYYDNLDLYSARSRSSYAGNMGRTFDIEPNRVEKDLIVILEYLESERDRHLLGGSGKEHEPELTPEEQELGMTFLKSPDLFGQVVEDMNVLGYVGEDLNKQLLYIAATSRKLDDPISVMIVSESSSGKSFLIDTAAKLIPPDEVIAVTSLSEQALNYMEDLTHKFVSLGETVYSETIEHQIREMLSAKELSRLVAAKDPHTGKMATKLVKSPAIVSLAMSGTKYDMNPENTSRCFVVNADESREQTRRIHEQQRIKKYSLERNRDKKHLIPEIIAKHHAAQKLLNPVTIVNPFGQYLDFPDTLMRTRRDNDRFIDLIACVCFLRQRQKERKFDGESAYIECDLRDYEIAYPIMIDGVLCSSLMDIPRGAVDLYEYFRELAGKRAKKENIEAHEASLTQREIREYTGLNQVWVKRHMRILLEYEYILVTRGGKARSKGHYRLRDDVPMEKVNLSMIPTPEEMQKHLKDKK